MNIRTISWFAIFMVMQVVSGCAVYMAATQPGEKNLALLKQGTPRSQIVAEFGAPITSEVRSGARHDIIKFKQGYSSEARVGRAVLHGAADVATLGLWEAVGTPVEGHFSGDEMSAEVVYDGADNVAQIIPLTNPEEMAKALSEAQNPAPKPVETSSVMPPR